MSSLVSAETLELDIVAFIIIHTHHIHLLIIRQSEIAAGE
jgi:hypothetical protein